MNKKEWKRHIEDVYEKSINIWLMDARARRRKRYPLGDKRREYHDDHVHWVRGLLKWKEGSFDILHDVDTWLDARNFTGEFQAFFEAGLYTGRVHLAVEGYLRKYKPEGWEQAVENLHGKFRGKISKEFLEILDTHQK